MNIKRIASKLRGTEAAEIAEAAVVLPLVFTLLLGIIWFGRAFNTFFLRNLRKCQYSRCHGHWSGGGCYEVVKSRYRPDHHVSFL
jgi:hypothetical protein